MELRLYIVNLEQCDNREEWVKLPLKDAELIELSYSIGGSKEFSKCIIYDYDTNINCLKIDKYDNIYELNKKIQKIQDLDIEIGILNVLMDDYAGNLIDVIEVVEQGDSRLHKNLKGETKLGYAIARATRLLDDLPVASLNCIDYNKIGNDAKRVGILNYIYKVWFK